jgi:glycosyltransferase involved in cell wall biosynthesis
LAKILHVYRTYFPDPQGGLQEAIRQIARATQAAGHEPRVFALSPKPWPARLDCEGIVVTRARSWAAPASCDLGGLGAFRTFAMEARWADVIHYHFPWPFADALDAVVGPDRAKVMTYHSDVVRQRILKTAYGPLMHRTLGAMDAIVATSPAYAGTSPVLANSRFSARVRVIPLGIEERTYPANADTSIFSVLGLDPDAPYFLFVGVLRYYKGLRFLVEAARQVNAPIVIAGSGPEALPLQERAASLGLRNVIFAGQVSDAQKVALLERCRALVLPSHLRSEAFGMVLIEASMYRRSMISCEVGSGTSYANVDGETGFVLPPENPEALASAMNVLLEDDVLADKFGRAARRRYEALFSGPALGKAYTQLYQDVLKNRP